MFQKNWAWVGRGKAEVQIWNKMRSRPKAYHSEELGQSIFKVMYLHAYPVCLCLQEICNKTQLLIPQIRQK
jgi:hypothetical protein